MGKQGNTQWVTGYPSSSKTILQTSYNNLNINVLQTCNLPAHPLQSKKNTLL